MKTRKQIIALCLMLLCSVWVKAQSGSHWDSDIYTYEYDMTVYYTLTYNDEPVADIANYEVAAFSGEECRGVGVVQTETLTDNSVVSYGYLRIRSNKVSGEEITLMVYDKALDTESHILETITFKSQDLVGIPSSLKELTFYDERPVTVTVGTYSREYGEENPSFTFTVEGPDLVGTPEITCDATLTSLVADYPIKITKGTIKNVNVTYVNGTLTVTEAPLTISGGEYSMHQFESLPELIPVYSGFKNDETEEVLTKKPELTTDATSASELGTYEIIVSGAEAQNYEITYVKGTLTITESDVLFGDANGDGTVNVTDIVEIVNYIMENPSEKFNFAAADVSHDGQVNVTDIVLIVTMILSE